jgi:outer membrane protein insertion porin family
MFPLTASDAVRGVAFCDFGTVEEDVRLDGDTFRLAPGFGLRVTVPALGAAPIALDFAFPILEADGDDNRVFSFFVGFSRF